MSLNYRKLFSSDLDQIDNHLVVHLFLKEPLGVAFGLADEKLYRPWIRKLTQPHIEKLQISWGCFEGDKLVGLILNNIQHKDTNKNIASIGDALKHESLDHPLHKVDTFIVHNLYKGVDIFGDLDRLIHHYLLSVAGNYGRRGIGKKLIELSLQEASDKGIKECFAETTGKYSGKIFEQLGFMKIRMIKYKDFEETRSIDLGVHDEAIVWRKIL
ncbi:uncharacterized protein [Lepeophtheirus salmonis]|uniref:uncharacterized protein isoform X2 n=1 Tax=Lepeophtheirus salmonis TaxID=72036 RepID=UPI001AE24D31|nr:uncharacterized protein LOC121115810 [Lepeophtheirus salmonis]